MKIKVIAKDNSRKDYNISSTQVTVGRDINNTISISDKKISRNHLLLLNDRDTLRVKDLGSTNGTYVNREKIQPQTFYTISIKSNIKIGKTLLIIDPYLSNEISGNKTEVDMINNNYPVINKREVEPYSPEVYKGNQYEPHRGLGNEIQFGIHATKSFVGPAWLAFFLYYIGFFIGGLIANILFLNSAKTTQNIIKRDPPGMGCLWFLIWTHVFIPLILGAIFLILLAFGVLEFM